MEMVEDLKESGKMIKGTAAVTKNLLMKIHIKVNIKKAKLTVKEFLLGRMGKFMMENGKMASKKAMVFGEAS